jgi:RNA polymerase sigma-70 factor (ECF subfamily)
MAAVSDLARMEACIPALRRYAAVLLQNREEADDLVHDCLVRALDHLHTRREDADLRPWLFSIMHNLFVSRIRRRRVRGSAVPVEQVEEAVLGEQGNQEKRVQLGDVMRAMESLPEEQRSVLLLISVEDLSYLQVSEVLGIPLGTVMSRLSRGRERLRQLMEGERSAIPRG